MKVLCESRQVKILGNQYKDWGYPSTDFEENVVVGESYIVYAIQMKDKQLRYLIDTKSSMSNYSSARLLPAPLFSVIDHKVSHYWCFNTIIRKGLLESIWGYPELTKIHQNGYFQGLFDLIDGDINAREIFLRYKPQFDLEFPDDTLEIAKKLHEYWGLCPYCEHIWEICSKNGITTCTNCKKLLNNPFWLS